MGLVGYPWDLPGAMKIIHNYVTDSGKTWNSRKNSRKDQMGVYLNQTHNKGDNDINNTKIKR